MSAHASTEYARYKAPEIIGRRCDGESCRVIAESLGIPEHQIWGLLRAKGYAGKHRALPARRRKSVRGRVESLDGAWATICESADYIEIERSSDGSGWIVSIDDLPGDQQTTVESAIASAFHRWRK